MSVSVVNILGSDWGLDLQNGGRKRQHDFLHNWQSIRIGARFHMPVSATQSSMNALRFGLCSGMTNVPGEVPNASVDNSLSFITTAANWSYVSGGGVLTSATATNQIQKIESGSVGSASLGNGVYIGAISSGSAVIRSAIILTITKGSPSFTFRKDARFSATSPDVSLETLYKAMESANPDVAIDGSYADNSNTIAMDEVTHGNLNTLFVTWGQTSPAIYVSELLVARIA